MGRLVIIQKLIQFVVRASIMLQNGRPNPEVLGPIRETGKSPSAKNGDCQSKSRSASKLIVAQLQDHLPKTKTPTYSGRSITRKQQRASPSAFCILLFQDRTLIIRVHDPSEHSSTSFENSVRYPDPTSYSVRPQPHGISLLLLQTHPISTDGFPSNLAYLLLQQREE